LTAIRLTTSSASTKRGNEDPFLCGTPKYNGRAVATEKWSGYGLSMKTSKPAIIAFVLWLLFFVSHAFAVFKPPYPQKAYPPDQKTVAIDQSVESDHAL
jgi:hypothetical protein